MPIFAIFESQNKQHAYLLHVQKMQNANRRASRDGGSSLCEKRRGSFLCNLPNALDDVDEFGGDEGFEDDRDELLFYE